MFWRWYTEMWTLDTRRKQNTSRTASQKITRSLLFFSENCGIMLVENFCIYEVMMCMHTQNALPRRVIRIVLTGGASAGKTKVLSALRDTLASWDIPAVLVPECATQLLEKGYTPDRYGQTAFQHAVFRHQLANENHAFRRALPQSKKLGKPVFLFCDRGLCDGGAYIAEDTFTTICDSFGYSRRRLLGRYQAVVFLASAAHLDSIPFDVQNGNPHRLETSREEVLVTDAKAWTAWQDHPSLYRIEAEPDFETKIAKTTTLLHQLVEMYL